MRTWTVSLFAAALTACAVTASEDGAREVVELEHKRLVELSGLAWSADRSVLWGHNDSGHPPELFRLGADGADHGVVKLRDADNVDWEDLAHIDTPDGRILLIGDIGDNLARRDEYVIYAVAEPARDATEATPLWRIRYRFADRPRDAEGLAWDPRDEALYLLTKRDTPPGLYLIPKRREGVQTAQHLLDLELPPPPLSALFTDGRMALLYNLPTALDISQDGSRMAVLTYGALYLYDRHGDERWTDALQRSPQRVSMPRLPQAEAIALSPDGRRAIVGSEARPGLIVELALPAP